MAELKVVAAPTAEMAFTNCLYVHPSQLPALAVSDGYVELLGTVYKILGDAALGPDAVALTSAVRNFLHVELDRTVAVRPFRLPKDEALILDTITFDVGLHGRAAKAMDVDCRELSEALATVFGGHVLSINQSLVLRFKGSILRLRVASLVHLPATDDNNNSNNSNNNGGGGGGGGGSGEAKKNPVPLHPTHPGVVDALRRGGGGVFVASTACTFQKTGDAPLRLTGQATRRSASNMIDTNFEKLGIGGLNREFSDIFRRAFVSRILPPDVVRKLGIKHVRGLMMHGPPGCGKTLIAREISKVLQGGESSREPKIVSGPEILSKFVGDSEKNVRELFAEAEAEQLAAGDDSELHVIVFDEIDAICRQRGTKRDGTGVGDSVVNQLLAKIDGVNSLNNVLLIGMTNRLDMIDSALLRPGRFEVQIEIGLPDEEGRAQILKIHTRSMREGGCLAPDVDIAALAAATKNFSGAELEGLVKSAASFATNRHVNSEDLKNLLDAERITVTGADFNNALDETHPAFGVQAEDELRGLFRNGIIPFSADFEQASATLNALATQSLSSARTPLLSVLLAGVKGSGKTALVAKLATEAGFAFTKLVTADQMIGMSDSQKCSHLSNVFEDSYKSPNSLIVLDDIERLAEYVPVGPRFCNPVLQALLVLINKPPPRNDRRLMIVATTSAVVGLHELGLVQAFQVELTLPQLESAAEVERVLTHLAAEQKAPLEVEPEDLKLISENCKKPIAVKRLLVVIEMARQDAPKLGYSRFMECLNRIGY